MSRNHLIIAGCLLGAVCFLTVAGAMMPRINDLRLEGQLVVSDELAKNLPPELVFTQVALGSFRGLAVDLLWSRTGELKDQGKFYEAMQLAEWITKLQPRFPMVWAFQAWNMAYNIAVATTSANERWTWVNAGVKLLRDQGIPANPNHVLLYKELAWLYLHKIGQYSDELHWEYKRRLAAQWQQILGAPPEGGPEAIVAAFLPIAEAYDAYVNETELGRKLRAELDRLILAGRPYSKRLDELRIYMLEPFSVRLTTLMSHLPAEESQGLAALRKLVDAQLAQRKRTPMERLTAAHPEAIPAIDQLKSWGFSLDGELLGKIAALESRRSRDITLLGLKAGEIAAESDRKLNDWLADSKSEAVRNLLLAFTRAKVIRDQQRMDPLWMAELMEGKWITPKGGTPAPLPLDWRHPGSHALYWSSMGVRRSKGISKIDEIEVLNTDRHMLHALQQLAYNGKILFDPVSRYFRVLPNPDYIQPYETAMFGSKDRLSTRQRQETAAPATFDDAHENFLVWAVQLAYFYGSETQADALYQRLRDLYLRRGESRSVRYVRPLRDFVVGEMILNDSVTNPDDIKAFVTGLIHQAIETGLATGQGEIANRYLSVARVYHATNQVKQDPAARFAPEGRTLLPPFEQMLGDVFVRYLTQPADDLQAVLRKARAWAAAPNALKLRVYDLAGATLNRQAAALRFNGSAAFPPPQGLAEFRQEQGKSPATGTAPDQPGAGQLKSRDVVK